MDETGKKLVEIDDALQMFHDIHPAERDDSSVDGDSVISSICLVDHRDHHNSSSPSPEHLMRTERHHQIGSLKTQNAQKGDLHSPIKLGCYYDDPHLIQIGSMPYHDFRVCIFKKVGGEAVRFFYEPIVLLDPRSMIIDQLTGQLSFSIELWNAQLEKRIIRYLREEVGEVGLRSHQVHVMPYEEIQLVKKDGNEKMFRLPRHPTSNLRLRETVAFDVSCDTEDVTDELLINPKFLSQHLAVQFSSPVREEKNLGQSYHGPSSIERSAIFDINIVRDAAECVGDTDAQLSGESLQGTVCLLLTLLFVMCGIAVIGVYSRRLNRIELRLDEVIADQSFSVPVFSASHATQTTHGNYVTYGRIEIENGAHGAFNKDSGIFTVKTPGLYHIHFDGKAYSGYETTIHLSVNGSPKASSHDLGRGYTKGTNNMSALLQLCEGDRIGIFISRGYLSDIDEMSTRFFGILYPPFSSKRT